MLFVREQCLGIFRDKRVSCNDLCLGFDNVVNVRFVKRTFLDISKHEPLCGVCCEPTCVFSSGVNRINQPKFSIILANLLLQFSALLVRITNVVNYS